ncbi:hypothetical protein [Herbiconiux sp. UC225_62]|uniref:phage tail tube protein n=1 Tax=Herbiconiux sp. UC225_62 TaxID=3350168 RepID=UPI0036D22007
MALDGDAVFLPGRGLPFLAAVDTAPPAYKTMTPAAPGTGWEAAGHTSRENNVSLSKNGGEATTTGSWWTPALRTTYSDTTYTGTIASLQMDKLTLDLAFNGAIDTDDGYIVPSTLTPVEKALFILCLDGIDRMGVYFPRVSIGIGDAPHLSTRRSSSRSRWRSRCSPRTSSTAS